MYTLQFQDVKGEHAFKSLDLSNETKLLIYLASFELPIVAVFEEVTVITKKMRHRLAEYPGAKSRCAREFCAMTRA